MSPLVPSAALVGLLARAALLLSACGLIGLAGLVAMAAADDKSQPAYSTGKRGHQLQWLPYRPTVPKVDPNVHPAAHTTAAEPLPSLEGDSTGAADSRRAGLPPISKVPRMAARPTPAQRSPDSPFNDPFDDRESEAATERLAQQDPLRQPRSSLPPLGPEPVLPQQPVPIDEPTAPRGFQTQPLEPLDSTIPGLPDEPAIEPREPALEPSEPEVTDRPAKDPALLESELEGEPFQELPPGLEEAEERVRRQADLTLKCISPKDFRPVTEINTRVAASGRVPNECPLTDEVYESERVRPWAPITFTWKASGLCHKPLYFEDAHLERYGHSWGPYVQPFLSGAHFFLSVPVLPYKMGLHPPHECMYTLGYYRPGNCAPYMLDPIPLSVRAGLAQAGAWVGGVYLIP